ncbi:hypothetical protein [Mesorhizobium sp.]|uniref:hypothetical protein n=1 Tax=Mesorhizobium sp. TaxID=1871066 RepID=UPI000FE5D20D|nr:hypothetical protein [Mesorhizobium sp.]RWO49280.1 MAG: hypothetical protein EOS13_23450 [Mesorhizobium sp.]TIN26706.1 MAG: hypothetical protein E5Y19_12260 [Mesorhizobium sp.]TIN41346.1 MAG: hypothetical protein E5Y13_05485 [Mesorhizobium sp.]TJU86124.1 MAG: hypothetical protein E5Y10_22630 [Mesorhizobium sp.]TJU86758.1 MAG: hypothetical protein E5Y15_08455 [Mesorhizobium sp.]
MHLVIAALRWQSNRSKAALLLGSALFAASASVAWGDALEVLQGVWVGERTDCTRVFEKIQGKVRFKDRTYASEHGFIITGNKGKGPVGGACTISQVNEENDRFSALLTCADAVVSRNFSWSFRIIDATHFERFDAMVGAFKYKKCAF